MRYHVSVCEGWCISGTATVRTTVLLVDCVWLNLTKCEGCFSSPVETPSYCEGVAARQGCDGRPSNSGVTFLRRLQRAHAFRIVFFFNQVEEKDFYYNFPKLYLIKEHWR